MIARMLRTKSFQCGFSLVEVIIVVAIIGILSAIAIPTFLSRLPNMRLNGAARDLYGVIMKAKGEAAKRNKICTLVFNQAIGGTPFAYVLFEDSSVLPGRISEYDAGGAGEKIIVQQLQWPQGITLNAVNTTFLPNDDGNIFISFRPTSIPTGNNNLGFANGTVALANANGRIKRVVVNQAGNVRITD